jgi:hypothetical protein
MKSVASELLKVARVLVAGGSDFVDYAKGTDPKRLFEEIRDRRGFEEGRGGYSGTIYEKDSFKVISAPVTDAEAQRLIDENMHKNDKWGPAFAIPVVGKTAEKVVDIKPMKVFAADAKAAGDFVLKTLADKNAPKGLRVVWADRSSPQVKVLKASRWGLKRTKKIAPKPPLGFRFQLEGMYTDSPTLSTPQAIFDSMKATLDKMAASGSSLPKKCFLTVEGMPIRFMEFEVDTKSAKGTQFEVTGKVHLSKPSDKVEGYYFFGIASS